MMDEKIPGNQQNYVLVSFETKTGEQLMEPLKIFRAVGNEYRVATPVLKGYLWIDSSANLTGVMTTDKTTIHLIYQRIGTLRLYHGLTDIIGEGIELKNGKLANEVAPVALPKLPNQSYYTMTANGLSSQVMNPDAFVPTDPTGRLSLVSLTADEKSQLDDVAAELIAEGDGIDQISDKKTTHETVSRAKTTTSHLADTVQREAIVDSVEAPATQNHKQQPAQLNTVVDQALTQQETATTNGNEPIEHLAQAMAGLIAQVGELSTDATANQEAIGVRLTAANQLLSIIKTLVK